MSNGDDLYIPKPVSSGATDFPDVPQHDSPTPKRLTKNPDQPRSWTDIAKTFDPKMPDHTYDLARRQYFDAVVRPKLSRDDNPLAAWNYFKGRTERAPSK